MSLWLVMLGMGALTYGIRLSFFVFVHHSSLPALARDALRYVTPAVLTAIVVPAVLYLDGAGEFQPWLTNARVPAALLAVAVAALTKSVWATIAAGMSTLWILEALSLFQ